MCCHYDLHITSQCGVKGRVMGIAWFKAAFVLGGFFVNDSHGLLVCFNESCVSCIYMLAFSCNQSFID